MQNTVNNPPPLSLSPGKAKRGGREGAAARGAGGAAKGVVRLNGGSCRRTDCRGGGRGGGSLPDGAIRESGRKLKCMRLGRQGGRGGRGEGS